MTRMSPQPTRVQLRGSTYRSRTNHELVARVVARKRALFELGIDPEDCAVAREPWPMAQEKRKTFFDMFRRKM